MADLGAHLLVIDGERVPAADGAGYRPVSPVDGQPYAELAAAGEADVDRAVAAARAAFERHRQHSAFERADWCHRAADLVLERAEELAHAMTVEHGKPLAQSRGEVASAAEGFRLAAEEAKRLDGRTVPVRDASKLVLTTRVPVGVFAVVTPFNFPLNIPVEYLGPLIANGDAAVWRPAPSTAAVASLLMDCLRDAGVPDGLVNLLTGNDLPAAQALVGHPGVDGVCFTGSSATGAAIARLAAGKVQLMELGGNGPIVVLADADLDLAARACASASFWNSGQSCAAAGRILVERAAHDGLVERLATHAAAEVLGSPFDPATTMGPVHTAAIAATMAAHVADATTRGARLVSGGAAVADGPNPQYWPATVLADVAPDALVNAEETFGPLAPVTPVDGGIENVLALANAGTLGLSGAVFGRDLDRTLAVAGRLRVGQVVVNDTSNYWELHMPFGGAPGRRSGTGRLGGRYAAEAVTDLHTVSVSLGTDWR